VSTKPQLIRSVTKAPAKARIFRLIALLAVIFGVAAIVLGVRHVWSQEHALHEAKNTARRIAIEQAGIIGARLQKLTPVAERIAADLSSGALKPEDASARLNQAVEENPDLFEAGIAYLPYAWSSGVRLFSPHAARNGNGINEFQLEQRYDYTTYAWFKDGIAAGGPHWGEPYLGGATKTLVVGYSVPFYRKDDPSKTPIGLVRTNLSLDQIQRIVSSLGLGETGYAFLLSRKGVYLSDPVADYMREQRTIFDVAQEYKDEGRIRLGEKVLAGERGEEEGRSGVTGQATWMFTEPIPISGWSIGTVFMKNEMLLEPQALRRSLIRIECCVVMFLLLLSVLWLRGHEATNKTLWYMVAAASLTLVAGISAMWWLTLHYPDRNGEVGVHIYGTANLQKFLTMTAKSAASGAPPEQVRTGIFVRTMRLGTANDVLVTGSVWQRYDSKLKEFTPGFTIPNAETLDAKETYHTKSGDQDIVGWDFKANLREPFAGSFKYPFDRAMMRVRIAPKGFYKNIVLTPDLDSYQLLVPTSLPGTDKSLVLPGWSLISSYFNYSPIDTGTSFGMDASLEQARGQELGFTMIAQRSFLDPFVSSVMPLIVVAALLFGMLIVVSKQSEKVAATGFKGGDVLRSGVTLLFPALVAQVNMRTKIGSSTVLYIEYFYFVLYTAILAVSANALLFTLKGHGFSNYRDNIIPKLIFWPALLGAFFIVTLAFLY
jgi:methyl-accepting chemotaxis protein-like sensor